MNFNFAGSGSGNISDENTSVPEIKVFITNVLEGDVASKIIGYFVINQEKIRFRSIAFGRIGGHNVSLSIAKKSIENIKKNNLDPELVQLTVQRKLIEGDVVFPTKIHRPKQ